jgi:hypothetical protein
MVACYDEGEPLKRPTAPFEKKPEDWPDLTPSGTVAKWPVSWNVPQAWGTLEQALAYMDRHESARCLCFVTHNGDSAGVVLDRWYVVDVDDGIVDGKILPGVEHWLQQIPDAYVETSLSGTGLHIVFRVKSSRLFSKKQQVDFFGAKADIYCDGQTLLTGDTLPFLSSDTIERIDEATFLSLLPGIEMEERGKADAIGGDWPNEDQTQVDPEYDHLRPLMTDHGAAIEGQGGSLKLFAAAANLAREGVPIEKTEALLRLLPAEPPFDTPQLRRTAQCAYQDVEAKGETGTGAKTRAATEFTNVEVEQGIGGYHVWTADDLEASDQDLDYIVEGLFVDKAPLIVGGREKCFKTSLTMDLAISLATGKPFLGRFPIVQTRHVTFFTAEIGDAAGKLLVRRIRESKGIEEGKIGPLNIVTTVPSFSVHKIFDKKTGLPELVASVPLEFRMYLDSVDTDVIVFDPLYFCLQGSEVGDMYAIGSVLKVITDLCKERNIWPIFCHHARKDATKEYQPMELGDLYGAGVSAFARQWMLVAHSDAYRNGVATMVGRFGGSTQGDGGLWNLTIDEGIPDEIVDRRWEVKVLEDSDGSSDRIQKKIMETLEMFDDGAKVKDVALAINRGDKATRAILSEMSAKVYFRDSRVHKRTEITE